LNIVLPEELAERLEDIARRENRPVAEVVAAMIERYEADEEAPEPHPLDAVYGVFDDDVTDMSTAVRETIRKYTQEKIWTY
jgi:metal-responsive CopG/Arc/MetJ family transcriptional regulator